MSAKNQVFSPQEKVRQVPTNVILPVIIREKLRYLSQVTQVPQAVYIREALSDLLHKYQDLLGAEQAPANDGKTSYSGGQSN